MNTSQRPLLQRQANANLLILVGLFVLGLCHGTAAAVNRVTRVRPPSRNAGTRAAMMHAEARKKSSRHEIAAKASRSTSKHSKSAARNSKAPASKARAKSAPGAKSAPRREREPEPVSDPILLHRAEGKYQPRNRARGHQLAVERNTPTQRGGDARLEQEKVPNNTVGYSARLRAHGATPIVLAEGDSSISRTASTRAGIVPRSNFQAPPTAFDSGVSRPDQDAELAQNGVANRVANTQSVVVRRQPEPAMFASTTPVSIPQPKVVSGFGAEMAAAPSRSSSLNISGSYNAEADAEFAANDRPSARDLAEDVMQPAVPIYTRSGKLMMPAPLKGSHEILVHQNEMADHDGLQRIQNDWELNRLRQMHLLVSFPENASLRMNESLPENRRYARPWTVKFAADAGRAFYAEFRVPLQVNSAVRTAAYQLRLQRVNGNAAAVDGDGASPHLTGQAIDLAKRGMSSAQIAWMRTYLLPLIEAGKVDVEEEFQQACFHVSVYRAYMPQVRCRPGAKAQVAQLHAQPAASRSAYGDTDR